MSLFRSTQWRYAIIFIVSPLCFAHEEAIVDHHDYIQINNELTLSQLIQSTTEIFPDYLLINAKKRQVEALQQRGQSWLADSSTFSMAYQNDLITDDIGSREIEAELELPLWHWGQREKALHLANQTEQSAKQQPAIIYLQVAGLVRETVWSIQLEELRYQQAKSIVDMSVKLLTKIQRRFDLGDLPRTDLLLAKADYLQKQVLLTQAEAEMMHSRKRYINLTQSTIVPAQFEEIQSDLMDVPESHPELRVINHLILQQQAEIAWIKSSGSGQNSLVIGGKSEKGDYSDDDIESLVVGISIPFGGEAHLAPEVAEAELALTELLVQRAHLVRQLENAFHEAKHSIEVTLVELKIANELKTIAETHLKMTDLSFSAGEINLMDLLKIQAQSNHAIFQAKEREIVLQKSIAFYNQAVGVTP